MRMRSAAFVLLSSAAWMGFAPVWGQTTGLGFSIDVETTAPLPAPDAPLVGKAEVPVPGAQKAPVAAPVPLTSLAGVEERLNDPREAAEPLEAWVPARAPGDWFGTGMVDLTFGGFGGDRFDRGRIAGYIEGTTRGGMDVVASGDTRELPLRSLFSDFAARDPDRVLDRMRSEQNYLTYGDDSTSREGAPTSGKVYLRLEKDGNTAMWGDFRITDDARRLTRSDRTLYGLRLSHESPSRAPGEASPLRGAVWAASPDRVSRRDVLRATGGAVYSLSRADVFPGTEKVMVRVVDTFTGRIVSSQTLEPGVDYRFNAFQGVVYLTNPLIDVIDDGTQRREVVVAYEHTPRAGDPDGRVAGGRVVYAPIAGLEIGVGANQETSGADEHTIIGTDATYETDTTSLTVEVARSEGPQIGVTTTDLGGFGNQETLSYGDANSSGTSVRLGMTSDLSGVLGEGAQLRLRHETTTAGFASVDDFTEEDERDTGVALSMPLMGGTVQAEGDDFSSDDGRREREYTLGYSRAITQNQTVGVYGRHLERRDPDDADNTGERQTLGARWDLARSEASSLWVFGHGTVNRSGGMPVDNRLGAGFTAPVFNGWQATAEASGGSLGPAGYAELSRTVGDTELAFGYKREALDPGIDDDREGEGYAYLRASQRVSERLSFTAESRDYMTGPEQGHANAFGGSWTDAGWKLDTALTLGTLRGEDDESDIKRRGVSFGAAFSGDGPHAGAVRLEYRRDRSEEDDRNGRVLAATGTYQYTITDSWRALASMEFIESAGGVSFDAGRYAQVDVGAAWRGTDSDRWSALFLLSRVEDVPGIGVERDDGNTDRKKATVISADINHKVAPRWTLGAKGAYRWLDSAPSTGGDFVRSSTGLAVLRVDYEIDQKWDVSADIRHQSFAESGSSRTGATVGVWRELGPNARLGVGYHAGGVHDDLRDLDSPDKGLFINMTAKF